MTKRAPFHLDQQLKAAVQGELSVAEADRLRKGFAKALSTGSQDLDAIYATAILDFRAGQFDKSVAGFQFVLERLDPDDPDALFISRALMVSFRKLGNYDGASLYAAQIVARDPTDADAYQSLCLACYCRGDAAGVAGYLEKAQRDAERMINFQPRHPADLPEPMVKDIADWHAARWRELQLAERHVRPSAETWSPIAVGEHTATLLGATTAAGAGKATFALSACDRKQSREKTVAAERMPRSDGDPAGVAYWRVDVDGLAPGTRYRCRLRLGKGKREVSGQAIEFETRLDSAADVATGNATPVGLDGITFNGSVGGTTAPTSWHYEYGVDPDRLDNKTPSQPVPPGRSTRVHEIAAHAPMRVGTHGLRMQFVPLAKDSGPPWRPEPASDAANDRALRILSPFGKDRNHLDGVGVVDLVLGWWSLLEANPERAEKGAGLESDLRDAVFDIGMRGYMLQPRNFHLFANCQTYLVPPEDTTDISFRCTSWCLTGQPVPNPVLTDGGWHRISFTLDADTNAWSYGANNVAEQGAEAECYAYLPLGETLGRHRGNLVLLFLFGNERETPKGAIDVYDLTLRCRNWSLLGPGAPVRLVAWPTGAISDPGLLTEGSIGDLGRMWCSGPDPEGALEFVWEFDAVVQLCAVRLFNNVLRPAADIAIETSRDGKSFKTRFTGTLRAGWANTYEGSATVAEFERPVRARFLRLSILSGHRDDYWGIDAIQVLGHGPPPCPEPAPANLPVEVRGLTPGSTVHYRLVAENRAGRVEGPVRSVTLSATAVPLLHHARVFESDAEATTLIVRLTAMGSDSKLHCRVEDGEGKRAFDGSAIAAGKQQTPRDITYVVPRKGLADGCVAILTASNDAGESEPLRVELG